MWAIGWGGRVTTERTRPILGSLGWRLLMAFSLVALGAVALVTAAALVGTGRGIEQAAEVNRELVSARVADAAAAAYRAAGSWDCRGSQRGRGDCHGRRGAHLHRRRGRIDRECGQ